MRVILILIGVCILFFSILHAQHTVLDKFTLQPLEQVSVIKNQKSIFYTNEKGKFDSSTLQAGDSVICYLMGYEKQVIIWPPADKTIYLQPLLFPLNEVVISAAKFEEIKKDIPFQIEVVKPQDIAFQNPQTSADMLQQTGAVFVQKSQMGGGSPVIRGFEASRVLIVVDGIRMNNAIFRSGHLQNVLRIDPLALERAEVVFGPSSVIYGSDALGGVMHFTTRKIKFSSYENPYVSGMGMVRLSSANLEKTVHTHVNIAGKKLGSFTSLSFSHFDDLRQGAWRSPYADSLWMRTFYVERFNGKDSMVLNPNPNLQRQSGYYQYDILQKLSYKPNEKNLHTWNVQFSNTGNVFRYDRLTETTNTNKPRFAEWYYGPEQRLLASYQWQRYKSSWFDQSNLTIAFQRVEESRHSRRFNQNNRRSQIEQVYIGTLNWDVAKQIKKHELRFGLESGYNFVHSQAYFTQVDNGAQTPASTRYPDGGSHYIHSAFYLTDTWEIIQDKFLLTFGGRFNYVGIEASFNDTTFFPFPFTKASQHQVAGSGNLGLIYFPYKKIRFSLLASSGFRSPNVDDLGKVFDSSPGLLIVPNPSLKPEYSLNGELGIWTSILDKAFLEINGFASWVPGLIAAQPFQLNGQDSVLYDGVMSKVFANQNANNGFITGFSAQLKAPVSDFLTITSGITYTYGRLQNDTAWIPLDHIPPLYGRTGIMLHFKKFQSEFYILYNGWKYLKDYSPNGEDNLQYATPYGMPAWYTLNLKTSYQVNRWVGIMMGLENILDMNYRTFSSGISAPGRNFIIAIRAGF